MTAGAQTLANVEKVSRGRSKGGTDLSGFDASLKHCSESGAVISVTIFSLLCCNAHSFERLASD